MKELVKVKNFVKRCHNAYHNGIGRVEECRIERKQVGEIDEVPKPFKGTVPLQECMWSETGKG